MASLQKRSISDVKFSIQKFWQMKSLARKAFQMSQDYYPETLATFTKCSRTDADSTSMGQLAIVNAPSSFTVIWNVMKPWLSTETIEKVDILGSDYQSVLLKLVDADSLPSSLGGNCTCSHAGGCQFSGAGPWLEGRSGWGPKSIKQNGVAS